MTRQRGRGGRDERRAPPIRHHTGTRSRSVGEGASNWIYGLHPIEAWVEADPSRIIALYRDASATGAVISVAERAAAHGVPVHRVAAETIDARAGAKRHQGLAAEVRTFPYAEFDAALAATPDLVAVVDQIQDPHNLGAIARSAEAAGAGALILPRDHSAPVTAVVEAAAAGATAWLPICRVTNLVRALSDLKESGYWVIGLAAGGERDLFTFEPPERIALLVGGESGVRPLVARQVDFTLRIPMSGHSESLNASVAAGIGLFTLRRRLSGPSDGG